MGYSKLFIYYLISLLDAVINFGCAIVGYYPVLEMSQDYLVSREMRRLGRELKDHAQDKETSIQKADSLVEGAKNLEG